MIQRRALVTLAVVWREEQFFCGVDYSRKADNACLCTIMLTIIAIVSVNTTV